MSLPLSDGIEAYLQQQEKQVELKEKKRKKKKHKKVKDGFVVMGSPSTAERSGKGSSAVKVGGGVGVDKATTGGAPSPPTASPSSSFSTTTTPTEDLLILSLYKRNTPLHEIAAQLGKTTGCVSVRVSLLKDQGVKREKEKERVEKRLQTLPAPRPVQVAGPNGEALEGEAHGKGKQKEVLPEKGDEPIEAGADGKDWTPFEDTSLRVLRRKGKSVKTMARKLDRTREEVEQRWKEKEAEWVWEGLLSPEDIAKPLLRRTSSAHHSPSQSPSSSHHASPAPPPVTTTNPPLPSAPSRPSSFPPATHIPTPSASPPPPPSTEAGRRLARPPTPPPPADASTSSTSSSSSKRPHTPFSQSTSTAPQKRPRLSPSPDAPAPPSPPAPASSAAASDVNPNPLHERKSLADWPPLLPGRFLPPPSSFAAGNGAEAEEEEGGGGGKRRRRRSIWEGWPGDAVERFRRTFEEDEEEEEGEEEGEVVSEEVEVKMEEEMEEERDDGSSRRGSSLVS